jgi:PadR family transcriptional regulator AphA
MRADSQPAPAPSPGEASPFRTSILRMTPATTNVGPAVRFSANEGVVLGMLARSPGSGYELLGRIRRSVGYFWTPARSHVYSLLPRLVELGYASRSEVAQRHAPDKYVYAITHAGRRALAAWLSSPELIEGPPRNPFLVKLFFGGVLRREEIVAHVRERRERIAAELADLEELELALDREANVFGWLALRYGLEQDRTILRWADEALATLGEEPTA